MNLRTFLAYRTSCPLCEKDLHVSFYSKKKQGIEITNDKLIHSFKMHSMCYSTLLFYKVDMNFSLDENSFYIDFNYNNQLMNSINMNLMKKFENYNNNIGNCVIYKYCKHCNNYNYRSNKFEINLKLNNIGELDVNEFFFLTNKKDIYTNVYELNNTNNKSNLTYYKVNNDLFDEKEKYNSVKDCDDIQMLTTNLIEFSSKEKMIQRLEKAIIFS